MVFTEYTTKKFIVMERIKGVRIDDIEGIEQLGIEVRVAHTIMRSLADKVTLARATLKS
jgi:predicted unusual protein kinase regulating ubiquinone biosynthesis (AarF/ABC1/UbiB family)